MNTTAHTTYPLHELLQRRWSPLAFSNRPVTPEQLGCLLEAARWAPSSYNEQPWHLIVATQDEPAEFDRLLTCLVEANQAWARSAPVLLLAVARLRFDRNGEPNRHAWYDVGQAIAHLSVQATALGLFVHQMAGFDADRARQTYHIPETHAPATAAAIGYHGDPATLSAPLQEREKGPRQRRPLTDFVYAGTWGTPRRELAR
jgi:nitroreductase